MSSYLGDGPARIGCESCGTHHGCVCDQLCQCKKCERDFVLDDLDDDGLCERCRASEDEDDEEEGDGS